MSPRIAVTLGDPRGIGPEIVAKAMAVLPEAAEYVAIGPDDLIASLPAERMGIGPAFPDGAPGNPCDLDPAHAGGLAGRAVVRAVELAMQGAVQGIVTAPAEKHALHLAGFPFPGHTEWLAELSGSADGVMMLASDALRVVLVTTHIPLSQMFHHLTTERVIRVGRVTVAGLQHWFGIAEPRLALCAVNPHVGEGGLFGDEDRTILAPAAEALGAAGPLPADTVFVRAARGEFDAVLAPYHDVGMTAIKMASFGKGVNVTLGLPFVRTSPDHGTAFDIAGRGIADAGSMVEAIRLTIRLVTRPPV